MPPESLIQPHSEILSPWDTKSWQLLRAHSAVCQQTSPHDQFEKIKLLLSSYTLSYSCMTFWPFRTALLLSTTPPGFSQLESNSSALVAARHGNSRYLDLKGCIKHNATFSPGAHPHGSEEGKRRGTGGALTELLLPPWA